MTNSLTPHGCQNMLPIASLNCLWCFLFDLGSPTVTLLPPIGRCSLGTCPKISIFPVKCPTYYSCIPMLHTSGWMRERHTYTRAYPCVPMLHTGGGWMTLFLPYLAQYQVWAASEMPLKVAGCVWCDTPQWVYPRMGIPSHAGSVYPSKVHRACSIMKEVFINTTERSIP